MRLHGISNQDIWSSLKNKIAARPKKQPAGGAPSGASSDASLFERIKSGSIDDIGYDLNTEPEFEGYIGKSKLYIARAGEQAPIEALRTQIAEAFDQSISSGEFFQAKQEVAGAIDGMISYVSSGGKKSEPTVEVEEDVEEDTGETVDEEEEAKAKAKAKKSPAVTPGQEGEATSLKPEEVIPTLNALKQKVKEFTDMMDVEAVAKKQEMLEVLSGNYFPKNRGTLSPKKIAKVFLEVAYGREENEDGKISYHSSSNPKYQNSNAIYDSYITPDGDNSIMFIIARIKMTFSKDAEMMSLISVLEKYFIDRAVFKNLVDQNNTNSPLYYPIAALNGGSIQTLFDPSAPEEITKNNKLMDLYPVITSTVLGWDPFDKFKIVDTVKQACKSIINTTKQIEESRGETPGPETPTTITRKAFAVVENSDGRYTFKFRTPNSNRFSNENVGLMNMLNEGVQQFGVEGTRLLSVERYSNMLPQFESLVNIQGSDMKSLLNKYILWKFYQIVSDMQKTTSEIESLISNQDYFNMTVNGVALPQLFRAFLISKRGKDVSTMKSKYYPDGKDGMIEVVGSTLLRFWFRKNNGDVVKSTMSLGSQEMEEIENAENPDVAFANIYKKILRAEMIKDMSNINLFSNSRFFKEISQTIRTPEQKQIGKAVIQNNTITRDFEEGKISISLVSSGISFQITPKDASGNLNNGEAITANKQQMKDDYNIDQNSMDVLESHLKGEKQVGNATIDRNLIKIFNKVQGIMGW
jgi:hypothetical protein